MLFKNFNEDGELTEKEIDQDTVNFEDLKRESMIDLLYGLRELLVYPCEDSCDALTEKLSKVGKAIELLNQYQPRLPEVNYLDEFLKDTLGEDAYLFTSDGKNNEDK
jgi:hypothetical protein